MPSSTKPKSPVRALVAAGAKIEPRLLVETIESGDVEGLRLLVELGASIVAEQASILRAACEQSDSDLLKYLLQSGIDIAPYPDLRTASTESDRLLRNARAGRIPPAHPTAPSWKECRLCHDLPDTMGWHSATNEAMGQLPDVTEQFETFGFARDGLWKCPHCGTYYDHSRDHDNGMTDGYDCEYLIRTPNREALENLRASTPRPQLEREIAALRLRVAFDDAVATAEGKVQIPDSRVVDGNRLLMIYAIGSDGARRLAYRHVPEAHYDALVADLKGRGFPLADTDAACDFVWVANADGVEVYDSKCNVFAAHGDRATLADGTVLARADFARVIAFASDSYVSRGVKAALRSGRDVELVTEVSLAAAANEMGDPAYSRNELLADTVWCSTLGAAIATWAGVGFDDQI